jgi:hypothetical protein
LPSSSSFAQDKLFIIALVGWPAAFAFPPDDYIIIFQFSFLALRGAPGSLRGSFTQDDFLHFHPTGRRRSRPWADIDFISLLLKSSVVLSKVLFTVPSAAHGWFLSSSSNDHFIFFELAASPFFIVPSVLFNDQIFFKVAFGVSPA